MKKTDNEETVKRILNAVGGATNIVVANHCATRLRLTIKDTEKVRDEELKTIPGVMGLVKNANEYQIVIGVGVDRLYLDFIRKSDLECQKEIVDLETSELDQTPKGIKGWFLAVTDFIAGAIMPALPVIVAGGMRCWFF